MGLIICLGDMKPYIRDLAQHIIEMMIDLPYVGSPLVASFLYKSYGLPKIATDHKHLVKGRDTGRQNGQSQDHCARQGA